MRHGAAFTFIFSFALLLTTSQFTTTTAAADASAALRYAFQPGQTYTYDLTIQIDHPQAQETVAGLSKYEVKSVDPATGQITMTHSADLSRSVRLTNQGNQPFGGGAAMRYAAGSPFAFANYNSPCQIVIDPQGKVIRYERKSQLPYLLGNLWALTLEPLPTAGQKTWQSKRDMEIIDQENSGWMPRAFMNKQTNRSATETIDYTIDPSNADAPVITRTYSLATEEQNDGDPVVSQKGTGTITFDAKAGMIQSLNEKYTLQMSNPGITVKMPITITAKLLTAAEAQQKLAAKKAAAAQAQAAVQKSEQLNPIDNNALDQLLAKIKSTDGPELNQPLEKLAHAQPIDSRRDEVTTLLIGLLDKDDQFTVTGSEKCLKLWGTEADVAPLMKLLGKEDFFIRTGAMDALVPHKNPDIAQAIASQLTEFSVHQQAADALKAMGDLAEKPVLPMLKNQDWNVRVTACEILAAVGTSQSIEPLKAAADDKNGLVQMKAKEALKAVQARASNPATQPAQ